MASGAAALLLQSNPRLTPADIKQRIVRGAARLADESSTAQGAGRGNAYSAFVGATGNPIVVAPSDPANPAPTERQGCLPGALSSLAGVREKA
jgi:hypothetical protein